MFVPTEEQTAADFFEYVVHQKEYSEKGFGTWVYNKYYQGWHWPALKDASDTSVFLWLIQLRHAIANKEEEELPLFLKPHRVN